VTALDDLENELVKLNAIVKLNMNQSQSIVDEYNQRKSDIEKLTLSNHQKQSTLNRMKQEIHTLQNDWQDNVTQRIQEISNQFSLIFASFVGIDF
jgi:hypothetical protein